MALLLKISKLQKKIVQIFYENKKNLLILFLIYFLIFFGLWIINTFGNHVNYVEIIYSIYVNFSGIKDTPLEYKLSFYLYTFFLPILFTVLTFILLGKLKKNKILKKNKLYIFFQSKRLFQFFIFSYGIILVYTISAFLSFFNFFDYVSGYIKYERYPHLYANPNNIQFLNPDNQKNLILFYFESLEYDIEQIVNNSDLNPIKDINTIKGKNIFNFKEAPTTSFSIAGVVSSQCSLPFYPTISTNLKNPDRKKLTCLSDILAEKNYKQIFYITVNKDFHNFGGFKEAHHYTVHDKNIIINDFPDVDDDGWGNGVFDDTMLKHAKKEIIKTYNEGKKFNFTIINTDTHPPYKTSPRCKIPKINVENSLVHKAYKCSSMFVKKFFDDLEKEGILKETVVVIMGDHLAHKNINIKTRNERNIYFKINTNTKFNRNKMNHFDVAPTILDELGFLPKDQNKFGFGVSLLNENINFDYEKHYEKVMNKDVFSDYYLKQILSE